MAEADYEGWDKGYISKCKFMNVLCNIYGHITILLVYFFVFVQQYISGLNNQAHNSTY